MTRNPLDILVLLRDVRDPRPPVRLVQPGVAVRDAGVRRIPNPSDLAALEVAVSLAEPEGAPVTALAIGTERLDDTLRLALSMGATRALRVWDDDIKGGDAVAEARVIGRVLQVLRPGLFFSGSRLLDRGDDPSPALAAASLGLPVTNAALSFRLAGPRAEVVRKAERGGRNRVTLTLPCAALFDGAAAEPRYPDMDAVLRSLDAPIEVWGLPELGLPAREIGFAGAALRPAGVGFPRPDPVRVPAPDPGLSGFDRTRALLSGGIRAREARMHFGSAEEAVGRLMEILAEEGLVPGGAG